MTFIWVSSRQKDVSTEENISTVETVSFWPYKGLAAWLMSGVYVNSSSFRSLFLSFIKFFLGCHNRSPKANHWEQFPKSSLAFLYITLCKSQTTMLHLGSKRLADCKDSRLCVSYQGLLHRFSIRVTLPLFLFFWPIIEKNQIESSLIFTPSWHCAMMSLAMHERAHSTVK